MRKRLFAVLVVLFLAPGGGGAAAMMPTGAQLSSLPNLLRLQLQAGQAEASPLRSFYAARDYQPVWLGPRGLRPAGRVLWAWLRTADEHGLNPAEYLPDQPQGLPWGQRHPAARLDLELALTRGYRRLARHLGQGRWDPAWAGSNWHIDRPSVEPLQRLAQVTSRAGLRRLLASYAPDHAQYRQLQQALARYRALAAGPWPRLPAQGLLRPGDRDPQVRTLRRRLRIEGYPLPVSRQPQRYDATLRAMVQAFQEDRGLRPDGLIGPSTRAALNLPPQRIAAKIAANLERWRWLPRPAAERHLLINVADYTLRAVEQGRVVKTMPVVIGRPERPTPALGGRISYLVFQPRWTVPPTILREDLAPRELASPGTLKARGFRVYRGWSAQAEEVDPAEVDWRAVAAGQTNIYRVVQPPGPANALGRVKFMFPNQQSIYLHDTPARSLFAARRRAFSSGCVRVADPQWLADWLLRPAAGWTPQRVHEALTDTEAASRVVDLPQAVPVYLGYWTARVGADGRLRLSADLYQRDRSLVARFAPAVPAHAPAGESAPLPVANTAQAASAPPRGT